MNSIKYKLLVILMLLSGYTQAQKLKEKDVLGQWSLSIDIDEKIKEDTEDLGTMERLLARGISGFVQEVLDVIDMTFIFEPDGVVHLTVRVPTEEKVQKETLTWAINKEGFLIIDEFKSEEQQINFDALWQLDGEVLQAYDRETREKESLTLSRI
ncbi:MAG: hypothetical protein P8O93_06645 [Flavobacteriaceae bacterium]|jgi:hypothetical protein|nr:hypothetical protein [Flavobacteriaceae bacterium]MDG1064109.1 hypothetical protein [Flavobacteriaceae bacterium]MDG1961788.1 hypothetical protein [Flavobacteriaceae bacterium]